MPGSSYFNRIIGPAAGPAARALNPPRVLFRETPAPELAERVEVFRAPRETAAPQASPAHESEAAPLAARMAPPVPAHALTPAAAAKAQRRPASLRPEPTRAPAASFAAGAPSAAPEPQIAPRPQRQAHDRAPLIAQPAAPPKRPAPQAWPDGSNPAPWASQKLWIGALEVRITAPAKAGAKPSAQATQTPGPTRPRPARRAAAAVTRPFRAFGLRQS